MKRFAIATATATALALALPAAAVAQQTGQPTHPQGMPHGPMHGPMDMQGHGMMPGGMAMMAGQPGPRMLLRMQGTLELTDEQVEQLQGLQAEAHETIQGHREAAREARTRAHEAMMAGSPDLSAFEAALEEAARHDVQATVAMARVHMQAAGVLTTEQQERLETVQEAMREMHGDGPHPMHGTGMGEGMQHGMDRQGG